MTSIDRQTDYWNKVAYEKSFTHPIDIKRISSLISKDCKILDYGCGYGRTCDDLWQEGYHKIIGVDLSSLMIERGRKKYPHLHLQVLESKNIPFESSSFDAVILFAVLTCIPSNEGQKSLVREIYRVLNSDGIVYVSDYWIQRDPRKRVRYDESKNKYGTYGIFDLPEGVVVRHHDKAWITKLLSIFEKIDLVDIDVITMNNNRAKGFQFYGRKI